MVLNRPLLSVHDQIQARGMLYCALEFSFTDIWLYGYISSKLIIKTPERRPCRRSAVVLLSLLLTLNGSHISSHVFIVNFNQLSAGWVHSKLQILPNLFELCNYFQYLTLAGSYYIRNC